MASTNDQRRNHARRIFEAAVHSVRPDVLLDGFDLHTSASRSLENYRHIWVIGLGKASLALASVIEANLGYLVSGGFVATAKGYAATLPDTFRQPSIIRIGEGGHPLPDEESQANARRILEIAEASGPDDLVIVLVTGGGSSVCADFAGGVTLDDARRTFTMLLEAGLDIHAVNSVRKQMSRVAGGRLADAIYPAEILALIISDVLGDDLSVIASGPTVRDDTTAGDAIAVLRDAGLWTSIPEAVRDLLQRGEGEVIGRPVPDGHRVTNHILATNATALQGSVTTAEPLGYDVRMLDGQVNGEARAAGRKLIDRALTARGEHDRMGWIGTRPICLLSGGETTVTVTGTGKGGRNQEVALAAAIALEAENLEAVVLSAGTDGIDGPTDAAGAVVTNQTVVEARRFGLDAASFLDANDSYSFFDAVGGLVRTGPTHTNVMDVQIVLI